MKSFCSKILLFGEYSLMLNSMALSVPYPLFEGRLVLKNISDTSKGILQSNRELKTFSEYLKYKLQNKELEADFDILSFDFDIAQGLYFMSNIPQGFGVGSSGALTASLYQRYVYNRIEQNGGLSLEQILTLKRIFGQMESHFHGSSSGADPLSCYLQKTLLVKSKTHIEMTEIPNFSGKGAVFLLNTGRPRKTEPLVNLFLEKCKNPDFTEICKNELAHYNDRSIEAFLEYDLEKLFENLALLSNFQFHYFNQMIPPLFRTAWEHGLNTQDYKLKLCGAGGGGFILGFTKDFDRIKDSPLKDYQIRVVYRM